MMGSVGLQLYLFKRHGLKFTEFVLRTNLENIHIILDYVIAQTRILGTVPRSVGSQHIRYLPTRLPAVPEEI